ncbi:MAG: carbohydrate ABC transporter permease [bacterium]|nr:carbohydrate ABC transporter permease [bacterium]MCS7310895.1 carbohydrate ABC transporter permease [Armatimonadota bacterium]
MRNGQSQPFATWKHSKVWRRRIAVAAVYLVLIALSISFLAPFALMVSTSLKTDDRIFTESIEWIPRPIRWQNYVEALESFPFLLYLRNTLFVCAMVVVGTVLSSALPAYAFARLRWRGRDVLFLIMLMTIMLPAQVTMLPLFVLFRTLGWTGTYLPLIIPPFFGSAFAIFLLRQFFLTIPQELSDAARLDGCSEWRIFWQIIVPLSVPALATVALFAFIGAWTDFINPLIYLTDESTYTLAVGLQTFVGRHSSEWNLLMAAATVVTLPLMVVFFFTQKLFIEGITLTGMKG